MNDKSETHKNYEILDGEDDVLLLGQATFTVGRFKQRACSKFQQMLGTYVAETNQRDKAIIQWITELQINEETKIMAGDIKWNSPKEGIDCQLLRIGAKGWQKGKLKREVNRRFQSGEAQTSIKFCPDEPPEQKSPLDDIRQSEEYKKLSNNN